MAQVSLEALHDLARRALLGAGADVDLAQATAAALVYADAHGQAGHGVARIPQYATHLRNGRADGRARPRVLAAKGGATLIDAGSGLAYRGLRHGDRRGHRPCCRFRCCALRGYQQPPLRRGRIPPRGGGLQRAWSGWPLATRLRDWRPREARARFSAPIRSPPSFRGRAPHLLLIDLSLSAIARGKLMLAANEGQAIPLGWALDKDGKPTTDPRAGLEGSMLGLGGAKGALLALMVELLVTALTGAALGFEATSFFVDAGNRPRLGQAFLAIDPAALAGRAVYDERVEALLAAMTAEPQVRLPGARRAALALQAARDGVAIPDALHQRLIALAG